MADIGRALLAAIDSALTTEIATGALTAVKTKYVKYAEYREGQGMPPDFEGIPPTLIVDMLSISEDVISIPPIMTQKVYPVRFQIFTQNFSDATNTQAAIIIDAVEDVFLQQLFSLADWQNPVSKDYTIPADMPFESPAAGGATLIFNYVYMLDKKFMKLR